MGIELNLYTALDSMEILPELSFFIHENVLSFYLFVSAISLISVL
jgi:hypothetical protein